MAELFSCHAGCSVITEAFSMFKGLERSLYACEAKRAGRQNIKTCL